MTLTYLIGRRNAQNTPWTGERDALLAKLWSEGYSASQIAEQIEDGNVTRCAVLGRVHRLKLPPRQPRKRDVRPDTCRPRAFVPKPRPEQLAKVSRDLPPDVPKMRRLKLVDLKPHHCRWPIGDGSPWLFCGVTAPEGGVYCPFHQRIARVRGKD